MKLIAGFLVLARAQDALDGPGSLSGPGAVGTANLLQIADDVEVDYFDTEDGKARPGSGWKGGKGSGTWNQNKNQNRPVFDIKKKSLKLYHY